MITPQAYSTNGNIECIETKWKWIMKQFIIIEEDLNANDLEIYI